jgi:hypothetical protein
MYKLGTLGYLKLSVQAFFSGELAKFGIFQMI